MRECQIKAFNPMHLDDLIELVHHTINTCYPTIYSTEVVNYFREYHSKKEVSAKSIGGILLCAFLGKELVGTGYLYGREIGGVYVHPALQRKGIGLNLITQLINIARGNRFNCVWLDATPLAYDFYAKLGFKVLEDRIDYIGENRIPLEYRRMKLKL